jgi:hypothetical protein
MNNEAMKEILNDLFSHLERLETQSEAVLQFLKEKKRVTDKQLAPYLEQAGNASSVRWRATRVRIEHLLSPEHAEKEVKLGKQPELQRDSASVGPSEGKRTEPVDKEGKRTKAVDKEDNRIEPSDTKSSNKDKSVPAEAVQARPADDKAEKAEEKSEPENKEQAAQAKSDEKSDAKDLHHPTEVTAPLAQQESAETAAQLNPEDKKGDQETA